MARITISNLYSAELEDEMSTLASDDQRHIQGGLGALANLALSVAGSMLWDGTKWVFSKAFAPPQNAY